LAVKTKRKVCIVEEAHLPTWDGIMKIQKNKKDLFKMIGKRKQKRMFPLFGKASPLYETTESDNQKFLARKTMDWRRGG